MLPYTRIAGRNPPGCFCAGTSGKSGADVMRPYLYPMLFAVLTSWTAQCAARPSQDVQLGDAVSAVRAWYQVIDDGSDQADLVRYGTVGEGPGPLQTAYQQLAPQLRQQVSEAQFLAHFRGLAKVKLLQAHASVEAATPDAARVLVEEERVMVIQGIPALVWFVGFIDVARTAAGWKISSLKDVAPEDIITLPLGGHMPWRADPEEVALVSLHCSGNRDCKIIDKSMTPPGQPDADSRTAWVTVQSGRASYRVDLAKLHSGEWVVLDKAPAH
jgi:hypothetical protein